ncbi:MAG: hydroxyacid dehydrogenase [Anaerolineae bacterium]|nr:hydroxyacid dehydrogenase [Anaerolineae bacterium]
MKPKVWLDMKIVPEALARLEPDTEIIADGTLDNLPGAAAAIMGVENQADGAFMDRAGSSLKVIARHGIGVNNVDIPAATERGILVVNTPDAPTESTAEHTVALLLGLAKRVVAGDMSMRGTDIPRAQLMGTEVRGRVLGVIGCGRIGRRVGEICALGLKMRVLAYDPYCTDWTSITSLGIEPVDSLNTLLVQADFVSLHASLTPQTRQLMGERELRLMKPGAYLINASRGPLVNEAALAQVLAEGHLAGAALDVFDPEPPLPTNPLLQMTNVVVTPHISSYTDLGYRAMGMGAVEQVLQVLRGEYPPNLLNPEAWPGRLKT